ncbi:Putative heterokaryon incompatibility [Septoria linicola]|uniref:Heterokaryon incompatibility n=1 Tax=Septoria linicola TaxID=215465 RepID=A0A9Q9ARE1_9PEZI|nr:putative heterokaryon incompatibility [Septoria linicola]USW54034.1 Putative heterokaryon incompatibility [Septoria linicola]
MPIKRSGRFKPKLSKAPKGLVVLPVKWHPHLQSTLPAMHESAEDEAPNAREPTEFTSSPPVLKQYQITNDDNPPPTPSTPNLNDLKSDLPPVSTQDREILNSITHAIFNPSTDLSTFFSSPSLSDDHIPEAIKLLKWLHQVELQKQADQDQSLPQPESSPPSPPPKTAEEGRDYLSALGKRIRALAEKIDAQKGKVKPRPEVDKDGKLVWDEPLASDEIRLVRILPESTPQNICCILERRPLRSYWNFKNLNYEDYLEGRRPHNTAPVDRDLESRMYHETNSATGDDRDIDNVLSRVHDSAEDRDYYTAVSYCWDAASFCQPITLNDKAFRVTESVASLLQHECRRPSITKVHPWLWIDSICLNQADNQEKSTQVQQMWRIFENAGAVAVWLGAEMRYTAKAFRALSLRDPPLIKPPALYRTYQSLRTFDENWWSSVDDDNEPAAKAEMYINALIADRYFKRRWIIPELLTRGGFARI